jgi:hypothetical protein
MKVLTIDIETRPSLGYVWSLWDQNVNAVNGQLREVGEVFCFAAKWLDSKEVTFKSTYHDGKEAMLKSAWELLDEADVVVGFNSKSFDIKHLMREFVLQGWGPPSPHKDLDLLTVCKGRFKFLSNKLQHISTQLEIGGKAQHSGFMLWVDCMHDDPKAWATMKRYNIQDIRLTEKLYKTLLPWIKNHPSIPLYDGYGENGHFCPNCGGKHLQKRGFAYTGVSKFQQYWCKTCGTWSKDGKRLATTMTRGSA